MHAPSTRSLPATVRHLPTAAAVLLLLALAACGGGSAATDTTTTTAAAGTDVHGMNGVGSGGTGRSRLAIGPVSAVVAMSRTMSARTTSGTDSTVTVNGITYADSGTPVYDDEGANRPTSDLKAGSTVYVLSGDVTNDTAVATAIWLSSDLIGSTDSPYDATHQLLSVMGQPVVVNSATALDGLPGGLAALTAGTVVEVSSMFDALTGNYVATRIDLAPGAAHFKVHGLVSGLDTKGHTFKVGTQVFNYAAAGGTKLSNGQSVAVDMQTRRNGAQQWVVTSFLAATYVPMDGQSVSMSGVAAPFTDATHFSVQGVVVDATRAMVSPLGTFVTAQSRVEVEGSMSGSTLAATTVTVEAKGDKDGGKDKDKGKKDGDASQGE